MQMLGSHDIRKRDGLDGASKTHDAGPGQTDTIRILES